MSSTITTGRKARFSNDKTAPNNLMRIHGHVFAGDCSSFSASLGNDTSLMWSVATRGLTAFGPWSVIYGDPVDREHGEVNETGEPRSTYIQEGVLVGGRSTFVEIGDYNSGTMILGAFSTPNVQNNSGVIIAGSTQIDQTGTLQGALGLDEETKQRIEETKTEVKGSGIFIRGVHNTHDKDDNAVLHATSPSLIQVSTSGQTWATELKGHLKLTSECTIYDASGTKIIENGKLVSK